MTFKTLYLDNILLKCANDANATEHHSLLRRPSLESVLSPTTVKLNQNPYKLAEGSLIQYGNPPEYGVVKWTGILPGRENIYYAGVEMVTSYDINVVYIQIVVYKYGYRYVSHCCLPIKLKYALSNSCEISLFTVKSL